MSKSDVYVQSIIYFQLIKPKELTNPKVDEMSMMTYLSQFPSAKLKPGAPVRPRLNTNRVRAWGPGLEPKGNQIGAPARFTIETFSAGKGEIEVKVLNPKGVTEKVSISHKYKICYTIPQVLCNVTVMFATTCTSDHTFCYK